MPNRARVAAAHPAQTPKRFRDLPATERAVMLVLAAGLLVTAILASTGGDHFRLPKELAFRAEAVILLALGAFWATAARRSWKLALRPEYLLAVAIIAWAAITTASSTNRPLSLDAFITIAAAAVIFLGTSLAAQTSTFVAIDALMIGCCINAVIIILQELKIWTPLAPEKGLELHIASVGLLGNPNDVGTYLVAPAVAAIVLAVLTTARRRWMYVAIGALLIGGIIASATRTAIVALLAALFVFGLFHSRRAAAIVVAVALAVGVVAAWPGTTLHRGVRVFASAAMHRDFEILFSERLVPFLTAIDMTRDHPLAGVGPGCFKYQFMGYRVALASHYPERWTRGYAMNWGEVHNDHLQAAAESGLPGYALFLAAITLCAGWRKRRAAATPAAAFARAFRWPLAVVLAIVTLGQFPMELAAPRLMLLTLGALCLTWDDDHVAA